MAKNRFLKVGDIVVVNTVLGGLSEYPVTHVIGNIAKTAFRNFNTKIWPNGCVYEYNKRYNPNWWANEYYIKENTQNLK